MIKNAKYWLEQAKFSGLKDSNGETWPEKIEEILENSKFSQNKTFESLYDFVYEGFGKWNDTPQGYEYWQKIYNMDEVLFFKEFDYGRIIRLKNLELNFKVNLQKAFLAGILRAKSEDQPDFEGWYEDLLDNQTK